MPSFSLRPVDASPSPTASASPVSASVAGSPPQLARPASASPAGPAPAPGRRRRLSPSSLRDVDLTQRPVSASPLQRRPPFPLPPTGHDLMALFPAQPPAGAPELRAGPTSGYFARQERAFFAQAGKEIVRVRLDIDLPPSPASPPSAHDGGERASMAGKPRAAALPRPWPGTGSPRTAPATSPGTAPTPAPYPALARPRAQSSLPATPVFPPAPHPHPHQLHHRTPSSDAPPPAAEYAAPPPGPGPGPVADEFRADDPDEAWRRPMPYNERRRAGKHTRRVVVRN
ncbi:hypothetical protein GGX14DRAFT_536361 [Mycena pura]|uniref:Uncharacterized protein n=1 Tax=Mycena pura TaxID=153505 RepID=A0AAD6V5R5_9AGAR|nr:hypothetical protein GGX14DRAFT_536361 [Mycena pura]